MVKELGLRDIDDFFLDIPKEIRIKKLNLPSGISQQEVEVRLQELGKKSLRIQKAS